MVGYDEDWSGLECVVWPAWLALVEHSTTHYVGADSPECLLDQVVVWAGLAVIPDSQVLPESLLLKHPIMDSKTAIPKRILRSTTRTRDETIERHAHVKEDLAHELRPCVGSLFGKIDLTGVSSDKS